MPQCADVFGESLAFPVAGSHQAPVIYNCDQNGNKGFLPSTVNTVGATACFCPAGHEVVGGVCVLGAIADGAQRCLDENREFSKLDGGSCAVAVTLSGGADSDRCYLSGAAKPQCANVFGATMNFFPAPTLSADGATLRFVYDCDRDGSKGFLPSTINTVGATACFCPAGHEVVGGVCVLGAIADGAQRCLDENWEFSRLDGGSCAVAVTLSGGADSDRCYLSGDKSPQCANVFGATMNFFPAPTLSADGATLGFVYDCDTDGSGGFLPSTVNTVGATACFCPSGHQIVGGVCVPDEIADGAQNCVNAGRALSAAEGGSCALAIRPSGGDLVDKCHFSDAKSPQCAEVFGAELAFPAAPGVTVVYNCDPDGEKGLVPATINTIGAGECSCAIAEQGVVGGVCRCADGEGLLASGACGVCAKDEEGVLPDGACGVCPPGHAIDSGVCVASAAVDDCEGAGWSSSLRGGGACGVPLTLFGEAAFDQCYFAGGAEPQCSAVFGSTVNYFPAPTLSADGSTLRFVYNCDPEESTGFVPSTINTVGATACACPSGDEIVGGVCVLGDIAAEARSCQDAGWEFFEANGGGCAVPLAPADGPDSDRCYFTGAVEPQCAAVFGSTINYFPSPTLAADGSTLRFVYDCADKNMEFIPSTVNTIGATACACPAGEALAGGACVSAAIAVGAQNCLDAGRDFSESDGGSCEVPVRPADGNLFDQCYFSGSHKPQCRDVFGSALAFPAELPAPAVYNCDLSGQTGFLPATINTVAATECACPDDHQIVGGVCVPAEVAGQCAAAGWSLSVADGSCGIPLTLSGGADFDRCYFAGAAEPQCAKVFGSTVNYFPSPTLSAGGATLRFVYNCDPDGSKGQTPASANTIGATECACVAAGEKIVGGAGGSCVSEDIAVGAQKCLDSGREFSKINGGSCAVAVTLSGDSDSDRCYLSGRNWPQCEDVFGADLAFPADPGAPLIYNCDPLAETGLIPATFNTVAATECGCGDSSHPYREGACVPKAGNFEPLSDDLLCRVFGGRVRAAVGGGVCSGMDENNTFCVLNSADAFPCRGLFKHLRICNLELNRRALNPFFCGEDCGDDMEAFGARCRQP